MENTFTLLVLDGGCGDPKVFRCIGCYFARLAEQQKLHWSNAPSTEQGAEGVKYRHAAFTMILTTIKDKNPQFRKDLNKFVIALLAIIFALSILVMARWRILTPVPGNLATLMSYLEQK